jgi:hypothetical protein
MRRCLGILILLGGLAGCEATPTDTGSLNPGGELAFGRAPLHEVFLDDPAFALPDIDCGTFIIRETSFSNRVHVTTYFNDAGEPIRVRFHVQFQGVLTNLSTGKTLRDHVALSQTFDFTEGTFTETGLEFHSGDWRHTVCCGAAGCDRRGTHRYLPASRLTPIGERRQETLIPHDKPPPKFVSPGGGSKPALDTRGRCCTPTSAIWNSRITRQQGPRHGQDGRSLCGRRGPWSPLSLDGCLTGSN